MLTQGYKLQKQYRHESSRKIAKDHWQAQKGNGKRNDDDLNPPKQRNGRRSGKKNTKDEEDKSTSICKTSTRDKNEQCGAKKH